MNTQHTKQSTTKGQEYGFNVFLDRKQLAHRWQVSRETIKRRERSCLLKPCRLNARVIRYRLSDIIHIEEEAQV